MRPCRSSRNSSAWPIHIRWRNSWRSRRAPSAKQKMAAASCTLSGLKRGFARGSFRARKNPGSLRNRRVSSKQLRRARRTLTGLDLEQRLKVPGLDPRRADLAIAGAVLLDTIVRRLGASHVALCDLSLREGLVLDYIARHR